MSEIEKMYRAAKVVPSHHYCNECQYDMSAECPIRCPDNVAVYSPFTPEKQLNIIKLISKQGQIIIENWEKDNRGFNITFRANSNLRYITMDCITRKTVEEALAQIVNDLWQDLTEEEKQQVKGILE